MGLVSGLAIIWASSAAAQTSKDQAERQPEELVAKMTTAEKLSQLTNASPAIERLEIPAYSYWTEALHGLMTEDVETTNFPAPIGLAATFDTDVLKNTADAIAAEVRANRDSKRGTPKEGAIGNGLSVWSPNVNIFRDPRWGRGQETYGEDPYLTGKLAVAFIEGARGPDADHPRVIATPKHFAVHSGPEATRHEDDVKVSLHDMEDTYLPAFRKAVTEGKAGSVMCAYNSVNGAPACANNVLLQERLRGAWGFKGFVVSDCGAVIDIFQPHQYVTSLEKATGAAFRAGVDNECTFGDPFLAKRYANAYKQGELNDKLIDTALVRLYTARYRLGDLGAPTGVAGSRASALPSLVAAHRDLDRQIAAKTMVLLKNDGALPLATNTKRIAVVGPLADAVRVLRGSYSSGISPTPVTVLGGLRDALPHSTIDYVPAAAFAGDGDVVPMQYLQTPDGRPGLRLAYFDEDTGAPAVVQSSTSPVAPPVAFVSKPSLVIDAPNVDANSVQQAPPAVAARYKAEWTGFLVPEITGDYRVGLRGIHGDLEIDGKNVGHVGGFPAGLGELKTLHLEKGRRYALRLTARTGPILEIHLVWKRVSTNALQAAQAAANNADAVVAVVGLTSDLEGEEASLVVPGFDRGDRTSLDLPADQQQLLEAVKATGKPLIVVVMSGSAINLSWAKQNADAIVQAWYPGQEGGHAVADVLTGRINPSGRLPLTFYRSVADLPPMRDYSMSNRTYRYFTGEPVYPFGYGLSYTRFSYGPVSIRKAGDSYVVQATVTNSGDRPGEEVSQLYLRFPKADGTPNIALRGFTKNLLQPGETMLISFKLEPRDLDAVTPSGEHVVHAGEYRVSVGGGQPGPGVASSSATMTVQREQRLPY